MRNIEYVYIFPNISSLNQWRSYAFDSVVWLNVEVHVVKFEKLGIKYLKHTLRQTYRKQMGRVGDLSQW